MKPSVKPAAHLRVDRLPKMPWNPCPRSRGIGAHLPWNAHFLYAAMQSTPFIEDVVARSTGVSYPAINPTTLGDICLPAPDLHTQKRIASFLDRETARIDELIVKKERQVEVLRQQEKNRLKGMFAECGARKWRVRHLGKVKNGSGFPIDIQGDPNNEIPFFKVKHLKKHGLDALIVDSDDTISKETAKLLRATVFPQGTIVFAKIGAALLLARFSKIGIAACLDNNLAAFIPRERIILPDYALLGLSQIDMSIMVQPGAVPSKGNPPIFRGVHS